MNIILSHILIALWHSNTVSPTVDKGGGGGGVKNVAYLE